MGKSFVILTAAIVLVAVGVIGREYFFPSRTSVSTEQQEKTLAEENRLEVTHAWKDGFHRYTGTFLLPHSCFLVKKEGSIKDGQIVVTFDVEDRITTERVCSRIATRYPFTVLVEEEEDAPVSFFLNGEEVPSRIRELDWQSPVGTFIDTSVTSPSLFR